MYNPHDRHLFLDSSKRILKCVLNHNGSEYAPVPIGYSCPGNVRKCKAIVIIRYRISKCQKTWKVIERKDTLEAFRDFKNKQKSVWSNVFGYVKVCIFW